MKKFFREYRVELAALLAILVGVFLLVERLELRGMLRTFLEAIKELLGAFLQVVAASARTYILDFTLSDVVGWGLIILMIAFIVWRVRHRFAKDEAWRAYECPKCKGPLVRIHRTRLDHFLTWAFFPGGFRYVCKNKSCRWSGLRQHMHHSKHDLDHLPIE